MPMHGVSRRSAAIRAFVLLLSLAALPAAAQFAPPVTTTVQDRAALRPPVGSRVAIIEFIDLQCPDCAHAAPEVLAASIRHQIPLVRHDFPLPFHSWSFQAAVNARWFDTQSRALGDQYRDYIFAHQKEITAPDRLLPVTQAFAASHKLTFPATPDAAGNLAALVKADYALGQKIGVEHTPTIWVVTAGTRSAPFIEVLDSDRLDQLIDEAEKQ